MLFVFILYIEPYVNLFVKVLVNKNINISLVIVTHYKRKINVLLLSYIVVSEGENRKNADI